MPEEKKEFARPAGIDRGVKRSFQLSTGEYFNIPDFSEFDERIRKLQRRLSKVYLMNGKKKSRLYRHIAGLIRKFRMRQTNIIHDFLHKLTTMLSQALDFIAVEDLEIAYMTRSASGTIEQPGRNVKRKAGLNRSILVQNWGKFLQLLAYKMNELGHVLVRVDPHDTSRTCPVCEHVSKNNRVSQAEFVCEACGHSDNADHNASVNILMRGLKKYFGAVGHIVPEDFLPKQAREQWLERFPPDSLNSIRLAGA